MRHLGTFGYRPDSLTPWATRTEGRSVRWARNVDSESDPYGSGYYDATP